MHGSWSIKAVLPTVAPDLSYDKLGAVRDGLAAQTAYLEAIDAKTSAARRDCIAHRIARLLPPRHARARSARGVLRPLGARLIGRVPVLRFG
jgi:hypothetical protein